MLVLCFIKTLGETASKERNTYGSFTEVLLGFLVGHVACRAMIIFCRMLEIRDV